MKRSFLISLILIVAVIGTFFVYERHIENKIHQTTDAATDQKQKIKNQPVKSIEATTTEVTTEATTEAIKKTEISSKKKIIVQKKNRADEILSDMTLKDRIYQMFIVTQEQLTGFSGTVVASGDLTKKSITSYPVGGIIYFSANIKTPDQCKKMIADIQSFSKLGLFISVDEEGGRVARIAKNHAMGTTIFPDMQTIGNTHDKKKAYEVGYTIGTDIKNLGFNFDFAPIADVNTNAANPVIGDRAFSSDPIIAAEMVAQEVQGFQKSRVICTLKHFPGHGDTAEDSHIGYAKTEKTEKELFQTEFIPFQAGIQAGAEVVMAGHIAVPNVTGNTLPASLSKIMITDILKNKLGFGGIVITDALGMGAITKLYASGQAAVMAVKAGADILLMPEDLHRAVLGIENAVKNGEISEERIDKSVKKILELKLKYNIIQ